jgi:RNA polymerase sigma-70 factor (ECF subfamily)
MQTCTSDPFLDEILPHRPLLSASARRLGVDPDDLVQETYLRALSARSAYRAGSNARAWLFRILLNTARSEHRRMRRDRRLEARLAQDLDESEPMPGLSDLVEVRRALARLSPLDREVLELADVEGRRYREVADLLGCPVGTVMSRLHRARRRLGRDGGRNPAGLRNGLRSRDRRCRSAAAPRARCRARPRGPT